MGGVLLSSLPRVLVHPSGPHTFRQSDTIGMGMAFADDLETRGWRALDYLAYPKILEKGLKDGINAMEFPLLNFLSGFVFLSGFPQASIVLISLLILTLNFWTAYRFLPRYLAQWGVQATPLECTLLWFCSSTLALQSNVIMPEGLSYPLTFMGLTLLLDARPRRAWAALLIGLGIAVKPTSIIALTALPFLLWKQHRLKKSWPLLLWAALPILFAAWWFTAHAHSIVSWASGPQIVPLVRFDPWGQLVGTGWRGILLILQHELREGPFPIFFGMFFLGAAVVLGEFWLVAGYLASVLAVVALAGFHILFHPYYIIGATAFTLPLLARVIMGLRGRTLLRRLAHTVACVAIAWGLLYAIRWNIWTWARDSQLGRVSGWEQGRLAREAIPKRYHLIIPDGQFPQTLLYIARTGTITEGDPFAVCAQPEYQRLPVAIVMGADAPVGNCHRAPSRTQLIESSFSRWKIVFYESKRN